MDHLTANRTASLLNKTHRNGKRSTLEAWASSSSWAGGEISNFSLVSLRWWSVANLRSFPSGGFISGTGETLASVEGVTYTPGRREDASSAVGLGS